jgi:hypothetical protein
MELPSWPEEFRRGPNPDVSLRFIRLVPRKEGCRLPSRQGVPPVTR